MSAPAGERPPSIPTCQDVGTKKRVDALFDAIDCAILCRHWHKVSALIKEAGTNPVPALCQPDGFGETAFQRAIVDRQQSVVELMIEAGVDVNEVDRNGVVPLRHALKASDLGVVRCLVEHGAEISAMGAASTQTLLMRAIWTRKTEIALYLIGAGAPCDYLITGSNGWSAADYALDADLPEVFLALVDKGAMAGAPRLPLEMAIDANALTALAACLARPDLAGPAQAERFEAAVGACKSVEARQILLSWRSATAIEDAFGASSGEGLGKPRAGSEKRRRAPL